MLLHWTLFWTVFLLSWTLCWTGKDQIEETGFVLGILKSTVKELLTSPGGHYGNVTFVALKSLGIKAKTLELVRLTLEGILALLRPLVRPVFRSAGILLIFMQVCRSALPKPLVDFLPSASSLSGFLGDVASDLGLGVLAQELLHHDFAGPEYSTTWTSWMHSCRNRALCDLGQLIAQAAPLLAPFVDIIGPPLGFSGSLLSHLKSGLQSDVSCGDIYVNCPHVTEFSSRY